MLLELTTYWNLWQHSKHVKLGLYMTKNQEPIIEKVTADMPLKMEIKSLNFKNEPFSRYEIEGEFLRMSTGRIFKRSNSKYGQPFCNFSTDKNYKTFFEVKHLLEVILIKEDTYKMIINTHKVCHLLKEKMIVQTSWRNYI